MSGAPVGWLGSVRELRHALDVVGADRDEDGSFVLSGDVATFLGDASPDAEVVVGADAHFYLAGESRSLAGLLGATSYGVRVAVF